MDWRAALEVAVSECLEDGEESDLRDAMDLIRDESEGALQVQKLNSALVRWRFDLGIPNATDIQVSCGTILKRIPLLFDILAPVANSYCHRLNCKTANDTIITVWINPLVGNIVCLYANALSGNNTVNSKLDARTDDIIYILEGLNYRLRQSALLFLCRPFLPTANGEVQVIDDNTMKLMRKFKDHSNPEFCVVVEVLGNYFKNSSELSLELKMGTALFCQMEFEENLTRIMNDVLSDDSSCSTIRVNPLNVYKFNVGQQVKIVEDLINRYDQHQGESIAILGCAIHEKIR